jgi:hypothetical protein
LRSTGRLAYADHRMKDSLLILLNLAVTIAKLCGPGGVRAVIAENLVLKQQLIVLHRGRRRAPSRSLSDRLLCGFGSLFLSVGRIRKVAIALRTSTLLAFHQALVRRKYHPLFSSTSCPKKSGPKGPDEALVQAIVELKSRKREFLDRVLFWNARDLERKLADFQAYYNATRGHASLEGQTPLTFAGGDTVAPADPNNVRWVSHCRDLVQLPVAA